MNLRHARIVLAVLIPSAVPMSAAELIVRDLSLGVEALPRSFAYQFADVVGSRSGNDSFSSSLGIAPGVLYSFSSAGDAGGWLVGAEATAAQGSYASAGSFQAYGLRVAGGYGYAFSDRWSLDVLAKAGYGRSTFNLGGNASFASVSMAGKETSYGAVARLSYGCSERVLIGLELGYLKIVDDLAGDGVTLRLNRTGMMVGLSVSWRLSTAPETLH